MKILGEQLEASETIFLCFSNTIGPCQETEFYAARHQSRERRSRRIFPLFLDGIYLGMRFLGQLHYLHAGALKLTEVTNVIASDGPIQDLEPLCRALNPHAGLRAQEITGSGNLFGRDHKTGEGRP